MVLKQIKKASLFGLDARIALAIFGTISAITGVHLTGIFRVVTADKIVFEMQEVAKAVKAYELDTDSKLAEIETGIFDITELKASTKPGWKRAYVMYDQVSGADSNRYLIHKDLGQFLLFKANDRGAAAISDSPYNECADSAKACYLWVLFNGGVERSYVDRLDELLDDSDGGLAGRLQQYNDSTHILIRLDIIEH